MPTADTLMNKFHTLALITLLCMPLLACSKADQATGSAKADETKDFISGKIAEGINEAKKQLETENIDIRNINVEFNGQQHDRSQDNDARAKAVITPAGEFLIDGKTVVTSAAQRALLLSYRQEIIGVAHAGMDLGADAADLGIDAAKEALWGVFSGKDEKAIEAAIKPRTEKIETAAKILCARLPGMLASQQRLAAALPEFKPYATLEQKDVEDCGKDDDEKEDVAASK